MIKRMDKGVTCRQQIPFFKFWFLDNYYKNGSFNGNGYVSVSDISGRAPMNILLQLLNCDFERLES